MPNCPSPTRKSSAAAVGEDKSPRRPCTQLPSPILTQPATESQTASPARALQPPEQLRPSSKSQPGEATGRHPERLVGGYTADPRSFDSSLFRLCSSSKPPVQDVFLHLLFWPCCSAPRCNSDFLISFPMDSPMLDVPTIDAAEVSPERYEDHEHHALVQPRPPPHRALAQFRAQHCTPQPRCQSSSLPQSKLDALPVEIFNQILAHLTHPRSHLPGFTEAQSAHDFPAATKYALKGNEDLTQPSVIPNWASNLFSLHQLSHPFNALSLTSRRCNELVESYCSHLVRACNDTMFNLPFAQFDKHGSHCVYPDLSSIVYRRLWLQHAPRTCVYCYAVLDCYPFLVVKRVMTACMSCFYRQTLTIEEVSSQYHISPSTISSSPLIRGIPGWVLRIDVEALALQLYRTRAFHNAHKEQFGKPCSLCAITRFLPDISVAKTRGAVALMGVQKGGVGVATGTRQIASMRRRRSTRRSVRCLV
ncbi:hypothetical protein J1614_009407 [Plenodomus biglobosus]|nr:hypothetical protein J1614_009407 [Plenodomus biglobosus]